MAGAQSPGWDRCRDTVPQWWDTGGLGGSPKALHLAFTERQREALGTSNGSHLREEWLSPQKGNQAAATAVLQAGVDGG